MTDSRSSSGDSRATLRADRREQRLKELSSDIGRNTLYHHQFRDGDVLAAAFAADYSVQGLAAAFDISQQTIRRWMDKRGIKPPSTVDDNPDEPRAYKRGSDGGEGHKPVSGRARRLRRGDTVLYLMPYTDNSGRPVLFEQDIETFHTERSAADVQEVREFVACGRRVSLYETPAWCDIQNLGEKVGVDD